MEIREVHEDLIGAVKGFLANREGFRDSNDWEGLFSYPWKLEGYPYGYAILDEGKIVAFIGTIFSERLIEGKTRICCNMTTWFVEEEYRPRMLARLILNPIFKMNDLLITALTPSDLSRGILERLGFKFLDQEQIAIPIAPGILSLVSNLKKPLVIFNGNGIEQHLDQENRKIFKDHTMLACKHFLIKENDTGEYCYGIATTTPLSKFRLLKGQWLSLCYLSDPIVFVRNFRFLKRDLWARRFFLLRYDKRLLPGNLSKIFMRRKKARQYKWKEAIPPRVDNLYSELVTFNKY